MKILGIGNAIVDVICKVEDKFITQNNLTKSTMKLVDEAEFEKLLSNLTIEETVSGGSVANSIVGLSQLGNKVGFIGKVSDDDENFSYYKNPYFGDTELIEMCSTKEKVSMEYSDEEAKNDDNNDGSGSVTKGKFKQRYLDHLEEINNGEE